MILKRSNSLILTFTCWLGLVSVSIVPAQVPTGTIAGMVTDSAGAAIAGVQLHIKNRDSGLTRTLHTSADGYYSAAALPPGVYQITAQASGFALLERTATVQTGTTTTVDLRLQIGEVSGTVTVSDTAPLLRADEHQVSGLISRNQIENLPLNGRDFLELAKLEPGVTTPARFGGNRTFVPVLGSPVARNGSRTRVTVDGGSI